MKTINAVLILIAFLNNPVILYGIIIFAPLNYFCSEYIRIFCAYSYNYSIESSGKEALEGILIGLASYANSHFASEEEEMVRHDYPDYEVHRGKHQAMLGKVGALIEDYKQGKMSLSHEVSNFLSDWLNKHILGTDNQYSSFMNGVGVN